MSCRGIRFQWFPNAAQASLANPCPQFANPTATLLGCATAHSGRTFAAATPPTVRAKPCLSHVEVARVLSGHRGGSRLSPRSVEAMSPRGTFHYECAYRMALDGGLLNGGGQRVGRAGSGSRRLGDHCEVGVPTIQLSRFQRGTTVAGQSGELGFEFRPRVH